ncbi:BnaAnng30580D [Brassica napus]|uniref:BnaAnng30580D protein n=2 Tax=Brassica TaxID=3705 RepID=A0A078JPI8_BRANA|nr:BnaAnng30580D [Brassica napus]
MHARMDAQQVRLDSLEDLLDFMAVDNPLMKNTLNARRGPLDAMISSRIHGSRPSETEHPPNYFENVIP